MNDVLEVPESVRHCGDVERPERSVDYCEDFEAFGGPTGPGVGLRILAGLNWSGQRYLSKLSARHGPVFRARLGRDPALMVSHPDHVHAMLRNVDGAWSTGLAWRGFYRDLDSGGLLFYGGDSHRQARRLLQPAFSPTAVAGYVTEAAPVYERYLDVWLADGEVGFRAACRRMFAEVSARIFMGFRETSQVERLDRAMNDGWQAVLTLNKGSQLSRGWRRARAGLADLHTLMGASTTGGTDLYARVMSARDEADWLDDEHVRRGLFAGVMFGAFDTTSSGVAAMAYLLARHPQWQARARAEAVALDVEHPSPEQLKSLTQLSWIWRESLRLYPVAAMLPRVSLRETTLGPHTIPAASLVIPLSGCLMNDPHWWTEPTKFDPERFSPARAEDRRHRACFLPFGGGAHACVGATLATAEALGFFHALLRRCRITLVRAGEVRHQYTPVGRIADPIRLGVTPI